jgi:hypothetical protein
MATTDEIQPVCNGCGKKPAEIAEYVMEAQIYAEQDDEYTPDDFVRENEGTYNRENGHFLCTACYIGAGMPSSPTGWRAP